MKFSSAVVLAFLAVTSHAAPLPALDTNVELEAGDGPSIESRSAPESLSSDTSSRGSHHHRDGPILQEPSAPPRRPPTSIGRLKNSGSKHGSRRRRDEDEVILEARAGDANKPKPKPSPPVKLTPAPVPLLIYPLNLGSRKRESEISKTLSHLRRADTQDRKLEEKEGHHLEDKQLEGVAFVAAMKRRLFLKFLLGLYRLGLVQLRFPVPLLDLVQVRVVVIAVTKRTLFLKHAEVVPLGKVVPLRLSLLLLAIRLYRLTLSLNLLPLKEEEESGVQKIYSNLKLVNTSRLMSLTDCVLFGCTALAGFLRKILYLSTIYHLLFIEINSVLWREIGNQISS